MTDRQKIKHAIAVLKALEDRHIGSSTDVVCSIANNIRDLRQLLEEKHETESKPKPTLPLVVRDLVERLRYLIKQRKPNFKEPDKRKWGEEFDRIIRIDKRTPLHLFEVIEWSQQDHFWQNNILSPSKLRKQLDTLELQMLNDRNWQRRKLQRRAQEGPTAKQKYMEKINANSQGDDE